MSHTPPVATGDTFHAPAGQTVNTVLGPIPASELGVVAVHEALLSVVPGAQYAPDITMDRAEIFEVLAGEADATSASTAAGRSSTARACSTAAT